MFVCGVVEAVNASIRAVSQIGDVLVALFAIDPILLLR